MALITADRLRTFAPRGKAELIAALAAGAAAIEAACRPSPLVVQHFLAQIATETGGFTAIEENLNYSAERLHAVWPKRFPTIDSARPFARNPEKLANKVYGGRLGNTEPGDGWRYRGGGMLQTTGRENYRRAGHENDPEALRKPDTALASALQFWTSHGLSAIAARDDVVAVRKAINGGVNGLPEARSWLAKAKRAFV